jgi:oligopeptide/dipeptide ABC transporter ATP-binding protein
MAGLRDPVDLMHAYPFTLSGGMQQRVVIAMALARDPKLLVADEPTTALDVTIQAQILELLRELQSRFGMAMLFITHNLGLVASSADKVCVMYAGRIVESGSVLDVLCNPLHPYTEGLLHVVPRLHGDEKRLEGIPGTVPDLDREELGCAFASRCKYSSSICKSVTPNLEAHAGNNRQVAACHNPLHIKGGHP